MEPEARDEAVVKSATTAVPESLPSFSSFHFPEVVLSKIYSHTVHKVFLMCLQKKESIHLDTFGPLVF